MTTKSDRKALRKFKFERRVGRVVMNPLVNALGRIGIHPPLTVELETVGRKSGEPRRVPLNGRAEDLTQDTLVRVHSVWSRVSASGAPDAYATKTLVNCLRATARKLGAYVLPSFYVGIIDGNSFDIDHTQTPLMLRLDDPRNPRAIDLSGYPFRRRAN